MSQVFQIWVCIELHWISCFILITMGICPVSLCYQGAHCIPSGLPALLLDSCSSVVILRANATGSCSEWGPWPDYAIILQLISWLTCSLAITPPIPVSMYAVPDPWSARRVPFAVVLFNALLCKLLFSVRSLY